jgi:hypothetical protein
MPVKWTYVEYKGWRGKCKEDWCFDVGMTLCHFVGRAIINVEVPQIAGSEIRNDKLFQVTWGLE